MLELAPMNISIPVIGVVTTIDGYIMTQARNVPSDIDEPTKCNYMSQMLSLVKQLHQQGIIIHGDLKLNDFLLCDGGQLRLCDFEESQRVGEEPEPQCATC